jgi:protein gp37
MAMAKRLKAMGSAKYQKDGDPRTSGPGFGVTTHADTLGQPLRWTRPRRIFVNSMSDLFHESVPSAFIAAVFDVMARCPQHTFQILTKRHARMRALGRTAVFGEHWPLPNVWLGVSVEDQRWADIRIPALLDTPAAVRFLSCEPLLGPVDLGLPENHAGHARDVAWDGWSWQCLDCGTDDAEVPWLVPSGPQIDWVIVGGESGPGARPMEIEWARSLVAQCTYAGVAPFVKQLGAIRGRELGIDSHGADWDGWPEDLRVREFPATLQAVSA